MYIVVEGEDPGFDTFVNGRGLARHEDALEKLALSLGIRPLIEFFSADENSMAFGRAGVGVRRPAFMAKACVGRRGRETESRRRRGRGKESWRERRGSW